MIDFRVLSYNVNGNDKTSVFKTRLFCLQQKGLLIQEDLKMPHRKIHFRKLLYLESKDQLNKISKNGIK